jgi:hypothetical protein
MDQQIRHHFGVLFTKNKEARSKSHQYLLQITSEQVNWAYDVWDELISLMRDGDNHQRTIGAQLLAHLAKSDPEGRMVKDLDKIMLVTRDKMFVTARHTLQSIWKIGIVNKKLASMLLDRLSDRFMECSTEKNCTLIRYDIIVGLKKIYDHMPDEIIKAKAMRLISNEEDGKYQKKYAGVWKEARIDD